MDCLLNNHFFSRIFFWVDKKLLIWFLVHLLASLCSIYLDNWKMILSFQSLTLVSIGFLYGCGRGLGIVLIVDLFRSLLISSFNFYFFLQPILMVLISSCSRYLYELKKPQLSLCIWCICHLFSLFIVVINYSFMLFLYIWIPFLSFIFYGFIFKSNLFIHLNMIFILCAVLGSFVIGMYGVQTMVLEESMEVILRARMLKELLKLIIFTPLMYLLFKCHGFLK